MDTEKILAWLDSESALTIAIAPPSYTPRNPWGDAAALIRQLTADLAAARKELAAISAMEPVAWADEHYDVMDAETKNNLEELARSGGEFAMAADTVKYYVIPLIPRPEPRHD